MKPAGPKVVERKDEVQSKRRDPNSGRKKRKRRQMQLKKAPVMESQMDL